MLLWLICIKPSHSIFQSNEISGVKGTREGQAFDSDGNCQSTIFRCNQNHDNDGGFLMICDDGGWKEPYSVENRKTIVRYNISQNNAARTFHLTGPVKDVLIYSNTIFIGPTMNLPLFLFTDYRGWADGVSVPNSIFCVMGRVHYSHGTGRHWNGSYDIAPGFAQARNVKFENNVYFRGHEEPPDVPSSSTTDPPLLSPRRR